MKLPNVAKRKLKKSGKGDDNSRFILSATTAYGIFAALALLASYLFFQYSPQLIYDTQRSLGKEEGKESKDDITQQLTKLSKIKFTKPLKDDWIITVPFSNRSAAEVD